MKVRRIKTLVDHSIVNLRQVRAKYKCEMAEMVEGMRVPIKQPQISGSELFSQRY